MASGASDLLNPTLNSPLPTLWLEDEIIGWIYQFYNAEQKEAIRAAARRSGRPRWRSSTSSSPRAGSSSSWWTTPWAGCGWRCTRTARVCGPSAITWCRSRRRGRQGDKEARRGEERRFESYPDSPINNPKAPPRRAAKRPQDIRLIDPACGAMHFGHYAFEVFHEIYLDEWSRGGSWRMLANGNPKSPLPSSATTSSAWTSTCAWCSLRR